METNMRALRYGIVLLLLAVVSSGCGSRNLKTKGRLVKNGDTFVPTREEVLRIVFVPILKEGNAADLYAAEFTGSGGGFQVAGKDLSGMPPGKYRAAIEYRGNRPFFDGNLDSENSPFVFDVDSRTREIVIDLDRPPTKENP